MPKAISPSSPIDHPSSRMSDLALRKKKNADAQAAFRARRANYISTLEETVTNLESVVLQLQDSCRDRNNECLELRRENAYLKSLLTDRDKQLKDLILSNRPRHRSDNDQLPSPNTILHPPNGQINSHFANDGSIYGSGGDDQPLVSYNFSSTSYPSHNSEGPAGDRASKFNLYYPSSLTSETWSQPVYRSSRGASCSTHSSSASHNLVESPNMVTSDMSFPSVFSADNRSQKLRLTGTEHRSSYSLSGSRSISPSTSPSSSTPSLASTYPFTLSDSINDHSDFDFRRQIHHSSDITLHGGTANVSVNAPGIDNARYQTSVTRPSEGETSIRTASDNGRTSPQEHMSSDGDSPQSPRSISNVRMIGSAAHSPSSPPPEFMAAPLSSTLAVIKAQSFGALRRARNKAKTAYSSLDDSELAVPALDEGPVGGKRQRLEEVSDSAQS